MNADQNWKPALAELIGTFMLVFIGAGAGALAGAPPGGNGGGVVSVALAHGIALLVIVYAFGIISGAHVNPAVTLGLAVTGKITWVRAVWYWVAQFLGGILAAYLLAYLIGTATGLGATTGTLTASDPIRATVTEAVLTFFLLAAVFGTGVSGRNGNAAGAAIGLVLTADILMGGSLTGGSMNPARTLGPALATGDLSYLWIYIVGPAVGAIAAALLYNQVFLPVPTPAPQPLTRKQQRR
jgi:MIP family channel proteins